MQNRCNAQRKRLKLEAGLIGGVLAARQVGGGRQAPAFRECDPCFHRTEEYLCHRRAQPRIAVQKGEGGPSGEKRLRR